MKFAYYTTSEFDRWDIISSKFYGTPFEYARIIAANPEIPTCEILDEGITVKIPEIESTTKNLNLPPWKE